MVFIKNKLYQNPRAILKLVDKNPSQQQYVEQQFIQQSQIPTFHFQSALPRLPVPKLKNTCERYLAAQRPLLIDEAYRKTEDNVIKFEKGVGQQLQKILKDYDKANKHTSYITELWFDKYLKDRRPLPLNYNPMLTLHSDEKPEYNDQLLRATNLVVSSLRFYRALKSHLLEPEIYHLNPKNSENERFRMLCSNLPPVLAYAVAYFHKSFPLDMSQYPNLFGTTRIPETDKDRLVNVPDTRHITVQFQGNFYAFDVLAKNGDILPAQEILEQLKSILNTDRASAEFPIGLLTTLERNKWSSIRHLLAENGNETTLKTIDTALFHVCLDSENPGDDPYKVTKQFLHGDGTNRWFDKSFSLIVAKDGVTGVNFEHSWGDGVAVLRYAQDIFKDSRLKPTVHPDDKKSGSVGNISQVPQLDVHLNDTLKDAIKEAKTAYKNVCDNLDVNYTVFEGTGKNICKKNSVSPDAVMQLAFQIAYHKLTGKFVSTYESCSTAAFKHGRTETIRPCTIATKKYTLAHNSKNRPPIAELKKMVFECSEYHNRLIKEAAMGQGFDRHLFALKRMAEKNDFKSNLFEDPAYAQINHDVLSTSTLNSPAIFAGGFAPVVNDGFGIGYVIKDAYVGALVTNYKDGQDGSSFIKALKESFEEIFSILQNN